MVFEVIKNNCEKTQLIGPAVSVMEPKWNSLYQQYFVQTHQFFDYYSAFCANDMSDMSIGNLSSSVQKLVRISPKPVFVFLAVPSGEGEVPSASLSGLSYKPLTEIDASYKIKQLFDLFKNLADSSFFYFGIDYDAFDHRRNLSLDDFWNSRLPVRMAVQPQSWSWCHFLGLIDSEDRVKAYLLKSLTDLAKEHNKR